MRILYDKSIMMEKSIVERLFTLFFFLKNCPASSIKHYNFLLSSSPPVLAAITPLKCKHQFDRTLEHGRTFVYVLYYLTNIVIYQIDYSIYCI